MPAGGIGLTLSYFKVTLYPCIVTFSSRLFYQREVLHSLPWHEEAIFNLNFILFSLRSVLGASGMLLGLVLLGRAAFVFPLSFIANLFRKFSKDKITFRQQVSALR